MKLHRLILVVFALAAFAPTHIWAKAPVVVRVHESYTATAAALNQCNGEVVIVEATFTFDQVEKYFESGKSVVKTMMTAKGTGLGEVTGSTYKVVLKERGKVVIKPDVGMRQTFHRDFKLKADQKGVPDLRVKYSLIFVVDETGEVQLFLEVVETTCKT